MTEPGQGYAKGYLALFAQEVEEETLAAADEGDIEAKATLEDAAENAADNLVGVERKLFLLGWHHGVQAYWKLLQEAYRQADEQGLQEDERRNFVAWWLSDEG